MTPAVIALCLWVLAAALAALFPVRYHWRAAGLLIVTGIPILGWVTWTMGPVAGLVAFGAGASILRWPLLRAHRWALRHIGRD